MGLFNPGSGTGSNPRARAQRLEMLQGILGFFTFMAAINAAYLEIKGRPAGFAALVLLGFCVAFYLTWRARRKVLSEHDH